MNLNSSKLPRRGPGLTYGLQGLSRTHGARAALRSAGSGTEISFGQLYNQAVATHEDLERAGVPQGAVVALIADRSILTAILFLAVGDHAAVAPIAATSTSSEVEAVLTALRPSALLCRDRDRAAIRAARGAGVPILTVANAEAAPLRIRKQTKAGAGGRPARQIAGKGIVLGTSGTTGAAKLVPLSAAKLMAAADLVANSLQLTEHDLGLEVMPLHHIHGLVAGLLAPLSRGARTVIVEELDPVRILELAAETNASWYTAVPTLHQSILRAAETHPDLAAACRFRFIRSSSSSLPGSVRRALQDVFSAEVIEAYGMTEASHQICSQGRGHSGPPGTVGVPPKGTVRVCDTGAVALPDGKRDWQRDGKRDRHPGEIMIRSERVTDGYLDNPSANAAGFSGGWLRTGDIGRIEPDGSLRLIGRVKEIINRGGAQVAPAEVEEALLSQPGVAEAAVFGVAHDTLGQDVAAAVVLSGAAASTASGLRGALFDLLSEYKVPSKILPVPELPKSPTGKLRRIEMEVLLAESLRGTYQAPQTPLEDLTAALFHDVLKLDRVSRHQDFFLSGGDSLSGAGLVARLNAAFGTTISADRLFRYPTPAELAAYLALVDNGRIKRQVEALAGQGRDADAG